MTIELKRIIPITNLHDYKLHLACWNGEKNPLDVFVRSRDEWWSWNAWRGNRDDFSRRYIFSLIDFYHEPDRWLYGGTFEVTKRSAEAYKVALLSDTAKFVGRLIVEFCRPQGWRGRAFKLENAYKELTISEILKESFTGEAFPGYEKINHSFSDLELVFRTIKTDWRTALQNVKGVYLITDRSNGKRYVGSAYGDSGIWSRWACYIGTGHGWTDELTRLIATQGIKYAQKNFTFSLLEYRSMKTDDKVIIEREAYWKEVLLSRGEFGYNKN